MSVRFPGDAESEAATSAGYALSFAQERLWFLEQLDPGAGTYNLAVAVQLKGALDTNALHRAFTEVVRRHESLRTTIVRREGGPVQLVHAPTAPPFAITDVCELPGGEEPTTVRRWIAEQSGAPFLLDRGPLLRISLLRLSTREHVLLIAMHHIVSDGWSIDVLLGEVTTLYRAFRDGVPSPLPELSIQYADFAGWQRAYLSGRVLERELTYWKGQLQGLALLDFPTDRPRPPVQTTRGHAQSFTVPPDSLAGLRALARQKGATPFMVVLAAVQVLLHKYTGQTDISVGTPVANRTRQEMEQLIGFFVNTLVIRTQVSTDASFEAVLSGVIDACVGAFARRRRWWTRVSTSTSSSPRQGDTSSRAS